MATDVKEKETEARHPESTRSGQVFRPLVDIVETPDELLIVADMPGATGDAVDINYEDGTLTIEGHVPQRYPSEANFLLGEYGIGDYHREFRVGGQVDAGKIHAEFGDGVLKVHLPRSEEAKPRKIEVHSAS